MISTLSHGFVILGALLLLGALTTVRKLMGQLSAGTLRNRWYALTALIVLFVVGYVGYLAAFWNSHANLLDLIVPGIFFLGACFVWLTATLSLQTARDIMRIAPLERENVTDPLTGVYNRRYLDRRLREEHATAHRYSLPLAVLLLDIDHFKQVNDQHGHQVGDQVLVAVARAATGKLRESDVLARYGGEEFLVIAPHTRRAGAFELAERLRKGIEAHEPVATKDSALRVTVSIGGASSDGALHSVAVLVRTADENLYCAKHAGRNRVVITAPPAAEPAANNGAAGAQALATPKEARP